MLASMAKIDTIGDRIKIARKNKYYSQQYLADRVGWSQSKMARIECNQHDLRFSEMLLLALALDIPLSKIIGEGLLDEFKSEASGTTVRV